MLYWARVPRKVCVTFAPLSKGSHSSVTISCFRLLIWIIEWKWFACGNSYYSCGICSFCFHQHQWVSDCCSCFFSTKCQIFSKFLTITARFATLSSFTVLYCYCFVLRTLNVFQISFSLDCFWCSVLVFMSTTHIWPCGNTASSKKFLIKAPFGLCSLTISLTYFNALIDLTTWKKYQKMFHLLLAAGFEAL